jgi:hypothetical protein
MTTKQLRRQASSLSRQAEREAQHTAMLAQHAARAAAKQEAIAAYNRYWSAWLRGGRKGPKPVKPRF